jgi:hypothetical protein
MYNDNPGARAHAARVRAEHEYEATELDATRRRALAFEARRARRRSPAARLRAALAYRRRLAGSESARKEAAATRP